MPFGALFAQTAWSESNLVAAMAESNANIRAMQASVHQRSSRVRFIERQRDLESE